MSSSAEVAAFNSAPSTANFDRLAERDPVAATQVVQQIAKLHGNVELATTASQALDNANRSEATKNFLNQKAGAYRSFLDLALAGAASANAVNLAEPVADSFAPLWRGKLVIEKVTTNGYEQKAAYLETSRGRLKIANGLPPGMSPVTDVINVNDIVTYVGEEITIRGWIDETDPANKKLAAQEWCCGHHPDITAGRIHRGEGDSVFLNTPRGAVYFTHPDFAWMKDWVGSGYKIPITADFQVETGADGKKKLTYAGPMPEKVYLLGSLWREPSMRGDTNRPNRVVDQKTKTAIYCGISPHHKPDGSNDWNSPCKVIGPDCPEIPDAYERRDLEGRPVTLDETPVEGKPPRAFLMTRPMAKIADYYAESANAHPTLDAIVSAAIVPETT